MADVETASPLPPAPGGPPSGLTRERVVPALLLVLAILVVGSVLYALLHPGESKPSHRVAVGRGAQSSAQLDVVGGVDSLRIVAGGDDLLAADTASGSRSVPQVRRAGDRVTVSTRSAGSDGGGPVDLTVRLARGVRWSVAVDGGAQRLTLDLADLQVSGLDVAQGVGAIDARLPHPSGALVTRIAGGAGTVALHLPSGVPARVTFASGAGQAMVDGEQHAGLSAGAALTTADWATTTRDRVDVVMTAGVGSLTLTR